MQRWRGLKALVQDTVDHGSRAVERLQKDVAKRPFDLLERVAPIEVPVKGIREIHDTAVSSVHQMIRLVSRVAGDTVDVVLDAVDQDKGQPPPGEAASGESAAPPGDKPAG